MLIRFLSPHPKAGSVEEVSDSQANKLLWRRMAERVEPETAAVKPATQRAVMPPPLIRPAKPLARKSEE